MTQCPLFLIANSWFRHASVSDIDTVADALVMLDELRAGVLASSILRALRAAGVRPGEDGRPPTGERVDPPRGEHEAWKAKQERQDSP